MLADPNDKRLGDTIIFEPKHKVDVGIVGVPFDGSTRGRPGARFAPKCIRDQLYSMTTYLYMPIDISIGDFGDANTFYSSVERNKEEIYKKVKSVLPLTENIVVLGGDHSITEPSIKAFSEKYRKVGLIVFDAHYDMRELVEGAVSSGTVMGDILRSLKGKLSPENMVYIGIRDFVNAEYYHKKVEKLKIRVFRSDDVLHSNYEDYRNLLSSAFETASDGVDAVYISFDVDSLDGTFVPGLNAPSPLGLRPEHVSYALMYFGEKKIVKALDVTEVAPLYDPTGNTCKVVASIILYFLLGVTKRKNS